MNLIAHNLKNVSHLGIYVCVWSQVLLALTHNPANGGSRLRAPGEKICAVVKRPRKHVVCDLRSGSWNGNLRGIGNVWCQLEEVQDFLLNGLVNLKDGVCKAATL